MPLENKFVIPSMQSALQKKKKSCARESGIFICRLGWHPLLLFLVVESEWCYFCFLQTSYKLNLVICVQFGMIN